jgi:hypothetical protein
MKVRIKKLPQARTGYQVRGGLVNDVPSMGGADYNAYIGEPNMKVSKTLKAVPREEANLEAEGGETVIGNIDGSSMPSFYDIKGPRHTNGGVPLNLPDDSFIFSDTKSMIIKDPSILKMFGVKNNKSYTPAELSKKYDLNKYRALLQDPNSDKLARKTAEMMIKNYTIKLGALALAQESKKGFPQGIPVIAKPYMEAMGIAEEDLIPKEEAPEQSNPEEQMSQGEEAEGPSEEMPMNMPNGEPVAQPQEMSEEMPEEMGASPMAMYGMEMGGYDMPFYNDPNEMKYGGIPTYAKAGETPRKKKSKEQLEKEYDPTKHKAKQVDKFDDDVIVVERDGKKIGLRGSAAEAAQKAALKKAHRTHPYDPSNAAAVEKGICNRMKNGDLKGYTAAEVATAGHIHASAISKFTGCENIAKSGDDTLEAFELKEKPVEETIPGKKKCECTDPETGEVSVFEIETDEDCMCGEDEIVNEQVAGAPPRQNPKWWLQDTVNTMGAFGELMGVQKEMPWEARVDLEEPRPTFLDPTRELAAQSEQASIASDAAAQFAGPQALNARLSAIQGQGAESAANTLSNINNQNVNIANQFEGQQVGIRNQEQMLNQQMANRVYDKNTIANQQFQNAKTAGRANMRQAYNTALTNRAKTDAMNQMYPNYQVDPSTGGMVAYTPTDKTVTPGEDEMTAEEYVDSISGYDPKIQQKLLDIKFGKKLGGAIFANGGFVYTDNIFPYLL